MVLVLLPTAAEPPKASESAPVPPSASDEAVPLPLPPERTPTPPVEHPPWPSETRKLPLSNDTQGGGRQRSQLLDAIPPDSLRGEIPSVMGGALGGNAASQDGWLARLPAVSFVSSRPPMQGATGPPLPVDSAAAAAFPPSFTSPPAASEVRSVRATPPPRLGPWLRCAIARLRRPLGQEEWPLQLCRCCCLDHHSPEHSPELTLLPLR